MSIAKFLPAIQQVKKVQDRMIEDDVKIDSKNEVDCIDEPNAIVVLMQIDKQMKLMVMIIVLIIITIIILIQQHCHIHILVKQLYLELHHINVQGY